MTTNEILNKYTTGEMTLPEANEALKEVHHRGAGIPGGARRHLRGAGALLAVQYFGNRQKRRRRRRGEHRRRERRRRFQGRRGIKRAASLGEGRRSVPDMEIEQKHVNKEGVHLHLISLETGGQAGYLKGAYL